MVPHPKCYTFNFLENLSVMHHRASDINITKEEYKNLLKNMKDEKFHELLGDYMLEISDPKNKDEYDEYLQQMQKEGELPKGMQLIRPDPAFCIKSSIGNKKDKKFEQALYINICTCNLVQESSFQEQNWMVPYMVGKMRYDQDDEKTVVSVVEVVFNPKSVAMGVMNPSLHKLLCDSAIDGAQSVIREREELVNRDYQILDSPKCKGEKPALLPVTLTQSDDIQRNAQPGGKTYREIMEMKNQHEKDKQVNKDEVIPEEELEEEEEIVIGENYSNGPIAPKYSILHSYPVDIGQFVNDESIRDNSSNSMPKELSIKIELPGAEGIDELQCDITDSKLILSYKEIYYLDIEFPYLVNDGNSKAKYIASKKLLKLSLPVTSRRKRIQSSKVEVIEKIEQEDTSQIENFQEAETLHLDECPNDVEDIQDFTPTDIPEKQHKEEEPQDEVKEPVNEKSEQEVSNPVVMELLETTDALEVQTIDNKSNTQENLEVERFVEFREPLKQLLGEKIFYNINLPDYKKEDLVYMHDDKHILLRYYDSKSFYYFAIETDVDDFAKHSIECRRLKDYVTLIITCKDEDTAKELLEGIVERSDLSEDEITSLELLLVSTTELKVEEEEVTEPEEQLPEPKKETELPEEVLPPEPPLASTIPNPSSNLTRATSGVHLIPFNLRAYIEALS